MNNLILYWQQTSMQYSKSLTVNHLNLKCLLTNKFYGWIQLSIHSEKNDNVRALTSFYYLDQHTNGYISKYLKESDDDFVNRAKSDIESLFIANGYKILSNELLLLK